MALPIAPPPNRQQNNASQLIYTGNSQFCYYHQTFGDKACMCTEPCVHFDQHKVTTLASSEPVETQHQLPPSRLLYVADKRNKCKYSIETGAAASVLPQYCANGTADTGGLPLDAANNTTITTYGICKRVVDVGLKKQKKLSLSPLNYNVIKCLSAELIIFFY